MNNKEIQEKILKEETAGLKKDFDKTLLIFDYSDAEEIIQKTIAEEKKRHDEFVKKLSDNILLDFDLSKEEDLVIIGYNKCLRDVLNKIVKTKKEIYGDEK